MSNLLEILEKRKVCLPDDEKVILSGCKSFKVFDNVKQLSVAAAGGENSNHFEVSYSLANNEIVTEAIVQRVSNGISANYTEAYLRRRDPYTMVIDDDLPSDKEQLKVRFGYNFDELRKETIRSPNPRVIHGVMQTQNMNQLNSNAGTYKGEPE